MATYSEFLKYLSEYDVSDMKIKIPNKQNFIAKKYNTIYNRGSNNSYKSIDEARGSFGIYLFIHNDEVIYIGECSSYRKSNSTWSLYRRVQQHFKDGDKGELRYKLRVSKKDLMCLNHKSTKIVIIPIEKCTNCKNKNSIGICREIKFLEAYLIGVCKPKFNF